jgi:DNA repair protein RadC
MRSVLAFPSQSSRSVRDASPLPEPLEVRGWSEEALFAALFSISEAEAGSFLEAVGGLAGLVGSASWNLSAVGLRRVSVVQMLATLELAARLAKAGAPGRKPLCDLAETARYLCLRFSVRDQEVFGAMFLDARGRLVLEKEFFRGTVDRVAVEPAEVLRTALQAGASKILLFHTHPSGDPKPSGDDILATRRFLEAAELVGLRLVDHLVIGGPEAWASVREAMGI